MTSSFFRVMKDVYWSGGRQQAAVTRGAQINITKSGIYVHQASGLKLLNNHDDKASKTETLDLCQRGSLL